MFLQVLKVASHVFSFQWPISFRFKYNVVTSSSSAASLFCCCSRSTRSGRKLLHLFIDSLDLGYGVVSLVPALLISPGLRKNRLTCIVACDEFLFSKYGILLYLFIIVLTFKADWLCYWIGTKCQIVVCECGCRRLLVNLDTMPQVVNKVMSSFRFRGRQSSCKRSATYHTSLGSCKVWVLW